MNSLKIERQNGGVPKSLPGEDHVSGLIVYMSGENRPDAFSDGSVQAISTLDAAEALGITSEADAWEVRLVHYQLSEIFRVHPEISLYVLLASAPEGVNSFTEIKRLQNTADGRIRQVAVWNGAQEFSADDVTTLQGVAEALDGENAPLSVLYAPKVTSVQDLPGDVAGAGQSRVSVVIAQAGSGTGAELYQDAANGNKASVSAIGVFLGLLSKASVHQSISWVKNFPSGVNVPAFGDGTLYRDVDRALVEQLDDSRYLFLVTCVGQSGSYVNDSHTMDAATSDYAMIENVRTMDKAVRGIRTYLIPELGGNVYINAGTGKLQAYSVSHLETTAGKALEDMEKAGELSGYVVEIDPEQDVLSTGQVEVVIRQVAVGVMRHIKVKIGFTKSV